MPNELQEALAEGLAELETVAGETFTFGAVQFRAWRVSNFNVESGKLESAPDSTNFFEALRAAAPAFTKGDTLTDEAGKFRRVAEVRATDLTTGTFRFKLP